MASGAHTKTTTQRLLLPTCPIPFPAQPLGPIIQKEELRPHEEKGASDWQCLYIPLFFKSSGLLQKGLLRFLISWRVIYLMLLDPLNSCSHLIAFFPQILCPACIAGQGKPVRGKLHLYLKSTYSLEVGQSPTANSATLQPSFA